MFHILFGQSQAGSLKWVFQKTGKLHKETIISCWEIFSIGPIHQLQDKEGVEKRFSWFEQNMNDEWNELLAYRQSFRQVIDQLQSIPEGAPITIWLAENAHEQTGLRFVLHYLKNRSHQIRLINTTKSYKHHIENVTVSIRHTGEVAGEQLLEMYEQSKQVAPLSKLERKTIEQQWFTLSESHELLRIWRNGEIQSVSVEHYDQYIVNLAKKLQREVDPENWMPSPRLIGEALGYLDQYVGDQFLEYRVRTLVEKGIFDMEGKFGSMRSYRIRVEV